MKPYIGITTFLNSNPKKTFSSVSYNYINGVVKAGGIPVLIPILKSEKDVYPYLDIIDGLIFTGGEDVSPLIYGEDPISKVTMTSSIRDEHEITLFREAFGRGMPILGICRGAQLINVALNGTLYQDINTQIRDSLGHSPEDNPVNELYHSVKIKAGTKLHQIFGREKIYVNSFHHQSVKDLGNGLKITAVSKDGIVEAYEGTVESYLMGIQWHPEDLVERYPEFEGIFRSLVEECR